MGESLILPEVVFIIAYHFAFLGLASIGGGLCGYLVQRLLK